MAYKYQLGTAILSGALSPGTNNSFDLGKAYVSDTDPGAAWNDLYLSGTAYVVTLGTSGDPVDTANLVALTATGTSTLTTVKAGTLSGSSTLDVDGNASLNANLDVKGTIVNFPNVAAAGMDPADLIVSLDSTSKDMQLRTRTSFVTDLAGTVTTTGLKDVTGVLAIDIDSLDGAQAIATGDTIMFNDDGDNGLQKETVDDLFALGPALTAETAMTVADDYITFLDGGASGACKKESWSDLMGLTAASGIAASAGTLVLSGSTLAAATVDGATDSLSFFDYSAGGAAKVETIADFVDAMAGSGLTAVAGVLSSDASPTPTDHGNNNATLVQGFNFSSVVFGTSAKTWTLPASPDLGDTVTVKAPSNASDFALTIAGAGGYTIDGEASIIIDSDYGAVALVAASGSTTGVDWYIK
jgi:hypothetical protein